MPRLDLAFAHIPTFTDSGRADRPRLVSVESRGVGSRRDVPVTEDQFRIATEYVAARKRFGEALAARDAFRPPPSEPPLEAIEPQDALTSRQELFCQHYAARPVATRAAMLAGYSTQSASSRGWKLLRHPLVLARLAELRASQNLRYRIEPDTVHDKLEAVFFEALESGSHAAAIAALKLQALLGGLFDKPRAAARAGGEKEKYEGEKRKDEG